VISTFTNTHLLPMDGSLASVMTTGQGRGAAGADTVAPLAESLSKLDPARFRSSLGRLHVMLGPWMKAPASTQGDATAETLRWVAAGGNPASHEFSVMGRSIQGRRAGAPKRLITVSAWFESTALPLGGSSSGQDPGREPAQAGNPIRARRRWFDSIPSHWAVCYPLAMRNRPRPQVRLGSNIPTGSKPPFLQRSPALPSQVCPADAGAIHTRLGVGLT
jgi:hypothetical protein